MKEKVAILLLIGSTMILGLNEMAFSDGGFLPQPPCDKLPVPDKGPWITGYFIIARDQSGSGTPHYNIHAVVKSAGSKVKMQEFMFSFSTDKLGGVKPGNLCANSVCDLLNQFRHIPCRLEVEKPFGLTGKPVLAEVFNLTTSNCGTDSEMMYGELRIRVVP